jgi:hypothetical protein
VSFESVTRWELRCDGDTTRGQCTQRLLYCDNPEDPDSPLTEWYPAVYDEPTLHERTLADLRYSGWLVARDGRLLCPRHVAALEYLARVAVDGLPFPDLDGEEDTR